MIKDLIISWLEIQLPNCQTDSNSALTFLHCDGGIGGTGNNEQQTDFKPYYGNGSLTLQIAILLVAGLINMLNVSAPLIIAVVILEVMILVQLFAVSITIPRCLRNSLQL